jgi:4-hydroxy-tetrahydrodipicolinate synthase
MTHINLKGLGVALVTPFCEDGSVDFEGLTRLIDYQIENGTDYLVVLGTTAETPTLTAEEKHAILHHVVSQVQGRVPIVAGIGGNCTSSVCKQLLSDDLSGISAILSVVPYYNKPSQEGLYQHYKAVAEATPLPVILYNVPSRTGVNMTIKTTTRIARNCANVIGIKEASGNITQLNDTIKYSPQGFQVICGDDGLAFSSIMVGAKGVISVVGNAFPQQFGRMVHLALEGDCTGALSINQRFAYLYNLLFVDGNPSGIKAMLAVMEKGNNTLRLPLVPVRPEVLENIRRSIHNFDSQC